MQRWATSSPCGHLLSSSAVKALILALAQVGAGHFVNTRPTQHDKALLLEDLSKSTLKEDDMEGIINGDVVQTPSHKYPYFAMPVAHSDKQTWLGCGASIISPTHAITAAHCYGGGDSHCSEHQHLALKIGDVELVQGDKVQGIHGGRSFTIPEATRICHPQFDGKCSHGHDIVLLRFTTGLPGWVEPVILNLSHQPEHDQGKNTIAIGFGSMEGNSPDEVGDISPRLREANLTLQAMSADACHQVFLGGWGCSDEASEANGTNSEQQVCAWSPDELQDTCAGDSGSPLLLRETGAQIAITSYGGGPGVVMQGPGRSCGDKNFPGLYSRVSAFKDFICSEVNDLPSETQNQCPQHGSGAGVGQMVRRGK